MLPEDEVRGGTVLAPVTKNNHTVGVHGLTSVKLKVLELGDNLLSVGLSTLLKSGSLLRVLNLGLDSLHVRLEVGKVSLLVEGSGLETERVDNVENSLGTIFKVLTSLLSRGISTDIDISTLLNNNLGSVNLEGDTVNDVDVVSVRDKLVAGNGILSKKSVREQKKPRHFKSMKSIPRRSTCLNAYSI